MVFVAFFQKAYKTNTGVKQIFFFNVTLFDFLNAFSSMRGVSL